MYTVHPKKKFGPFLIIRTYLCVELPEKMRGPWNFFCVDSTHKSVKTSICSDVLQSLCRIISRQSLSKQLLEKSCELWLNFHIIFRTLCCWVVIFIDFHCTTNWWEGQRKVVNNCGKNIMWHASRMMLWESISASWRLLSTFVVLLESYSLYQFKWVCQALFFTFYYSDVTTSQKTTFPMT